jgi:hypothetical protein
MNAGANTPASVPPLIANALALGERDRAGGGKNVTRLANLQNPVAFEDSIPAGGPARRLPRTLKLFSSYLAETILEVTEFCHVGSVWSRWVARRRTFTAKGSIGRHVETAHRRRDPRDFGPASADLSVPHTTFVSLIAALLFSGGGDYHAW